jgi:DNA adenine methylase
MTEVMLTEVPPVFPWPGGKRRIARAIAATFPETFGRYFEPFVGSAAVFLAIDPPRATLGDHNEELINFFVSIRDSPGPFRELLSMLSTDGETYYRVRRMRPVDGVSRAVRFLYLTSLSFNGIFRVNQKGRFNTPYGGRTYASLQTPRWLDALSARLQGVELLSADFESTLESATPGDLVYLDPPYTVSHANNGFLRYNERLFSFDDQRRLAACARRLSNAGCTVVVSNAFHPEIAELYRGFQPIEIKRWSSMAANPAKRKDVQEYVLVGLPRRNGKSPSHSPLESLGIPMDAPYVSS